MIWCFSPIYQGVTARDSMRQWRLRALAYLHGHGEVLRHLWAEQNVSTLLAEGDAGRANFQDVKLGGGCGPRGNAQHAGLGSVARHLEVGEASSVAFNGLADLGQG